MEMAIPFGIASLHALFSDRRRKRVNGDGIRAIALWERKGDRSCCDSAILDKRAIGIGRKKSCQLSPI
ncbi:hypothetical protein QUA07_28320 [Microcoleus sp. T3_A4]|uniref:hypothetical protein n=1 Tax=Microcoleus sp. T3_A4 TaxID=2818968 RepID=UPI002FD60773